jgi:hypothetical protein
MTIGGRTWCHLIIVTTTAKAMSDLSSVRFYDKMPHAGRFGPLGSKLRPRGSSLTIPWPVDHRGRPLERHASALEPQHWWCKLRDRRSGTRAIQHDDIGGIADGDAVIFEVS